MIRPMDMVFITMLMDPNMKENGKTISNTALGLKNGLMEADIKDYT
jgi:hypothetical protein